MSVIKARKLKAIRQALKAGDEERQISRHQDVSIYIVKTVNKFVFEKNQVIIKVI